MANVGRISGPLLKSNLLRNGTDLAFETDLLYLDVNNGRVGIKNSSPAYELDITGTARATAFIGGIATIDDVEINDSTIKTTVGDLTLEGATASDKVYIPHVNIPDVQGDVQITGSLHATGNITADGNIVLGDSDTDNVSFGADVNSDILPNIPDNYQLGSPTKRWRTGHFHNINAGNVQISDNILETTNTNDDLIIRANGSGTVNIYGLEIGPSGDINVVDGSRFEVGNIRVNGDNDNTGIFALESNTDINVNSSGTGRVLLNGIDILGDQGNTYYVTANGSDSNDGFTEASAFATVKYALSQTTSGDTIFLGSGEFEEIAPLTVPQGVQIVGNGLRTTQLKPTAATRTENFFLLNGECTIENLTVREIEYDSLNDTGYAFTYASGATVTRRSAYLRHITVLNFGSSVRLGTNAADDPYGFDSGDAGRGALMDASVMSSSLEYAMLFDSVTFIVPNSKGLVITEGGRVEWLNSFVYFGSQGVEGLAGTSGVAGDGKTYIELSGVSGGPFQVETVRFTSTDGSTVIDATVESVDGNTLVIDGRFDDLDGEDLTFEDSTASITGLTSGATATSVIRYDRKEFGAELRSIASANVYGTIGVRADGPDVRLRLSSHDFGYIGSGKKFDNNDNDVVTANEVVEANGGRVFYNSTDQYGDYRIGDLFYVDQDTGSVTFTGGAFDVSSITGINFTSGPNTTIVDPTQVATGNIVIAGNTISTTTGDLNLAPIDEVNVNSPLNVSNTLDVNQQATLASANVEDLTNDRIVIAGTDGELEDDANFTFNGTELNVGQGNFTVQQASGNTYVNGTFNVQGDSVFNTVQIERLTVTNNLTINGDISGGALQTDDVKIAGNRIETTSSDSNLELNTQGTGTIELLTDTNITGNLEVSGDITLGGNITIGDQDTDSITVAADFESNLIPNSDNTFTVGSASKRWKNVYSDIITSRQFDVDTIQTDNIRIQGNRIEATLSESDLELIANGNGSVAVRDNFLVYGGAFVFGELTSSQTLNTPRIVSEDVVIEQNTIHTANSDSNLELYAAGSGVVEIREDALINGNLDVLGNISIGGNLTLGNQTTDSITVVADFTSNLVPDASNLFDLGTATKGWRELYAGRATIDSITIDTQVITTNESNANLQLDANGTGVVEIVNPGFLIPVGDTASRPSAQTGLIRFNTDTVQFEGYQGTSWSSLGGVRDVDNDTYIIPEVSAGSDEDTLYFYTGGDLSATLNSTRFDSVKITVDQLELDDRLITVSDTDGNLQLSGNGNGYVDFVQTSAIKLPVGTEAQRPTGITGQIRFNTDTSQYEGYNGSSWSSLGGVRDVDNDTYILPELTPGGDQDTLYFYAGGKEIARFNQTTISVLDQDLQNNEVRLRDNRIETYNSNADLILDANGLGTVNINTNTYIDGFLDVSGDIFLGGNIRIGDQDVDTITVIADFTSDLLPNSPNQYSLGTIGKGWKELHTGHIFVDSIEINDSYIRTIDSDADLELSASGTGVVSFTDTSAIKISVGTNAERPGTASSGMVRFNTDTTQFEGYNGIAWSSLGGVRDVNNDTYIIPESSPGANEDTLFFYANGSLIAEFAENSIDLDQIEITNNQISTNQTDADLVLNANGNGVVYIAGTGAFRIPAGGNADRPAAFADIGWIRWNTDTNSLEAWNGVQFQAVGGGTSSDANGDTLITYETNGNNEDIIRFYAGVADPASPATGTIGSNEIMTVSNEGLLVSGKIRIQDNVIENTVSDEDLIIRASGTGRVRIDGGGQASSEGNVFMTDPLFTLNETAIGNNQVDMGIILERGADINAGMIFDESEDAFAFVKTIEQGTVKGNVSITDYWDGHFASVKLNSETANKVSFTDASKVVRSLDTGRTAQVDGTMVFNTGTGNLVIPNGTEAQRPTSPVQGNIRYNSDTEIYEAYYGDKGWDGLGIAQGTPADHQKFLGDGNTFEFLLKKDPQSTVNLMVSINGVVQEPEFAYEVDGRILRFIDESSTVVAPEDEARIDVRFLSAPAYHTVRRSEHTGDGSTKRFGSSLIITDPATVLVFVENIYQDPAVYSVDGTDIVFTDEAPAQGDRISIVNFATINSPNTITRQEADDSAIAFAIALG